MVSMFISRSLTLCILMPTFLFNFTEDGIMVVDGEQSDVVVVYDVLRIFKAIVGIDEVIKCRHLLKSERFAENDVEDLS